VGRAQSPIVPEGRRVVWPKCNFSKESYREGLSRLDIRRRCCRSRKEVGEDRSPQQVVVAVQLLEGLMSAEDVAVTENKRGGRLNLCNRRRYVESLSYTASEVVGRGGSSPEPNCARRPTSRVAEVQLLEGIVLRGVVASVYQPKMLP
jgi:hypothetical protein